MEMFFEGGLVGGGGGGGGNGGGVVCKNIARKWGEKRSKS
jgi:hypothetical protein